MLADPPPEQRLEILKDVWSIVSKLEDPGQYISCAEVWVQFAVKHFTVSFILFLTIFVIREFIFLFKNVSLLVHK